MGALEKPWTVKNKTVSVNFSPVRIVDTSVQSPLVT